MGVLPCTNPEPDEGFVILSKAFVIPSEALVIPSEAICHPELKRFVIPSEARVSIYQPQFFIAFPPIAG